MRWFTSHFYWRPCANSIVSIPPTDFYWVLCFLSWLDMTFKQAPVVKKLYVYKIILQFFCRQLYIIYCCASKIWYFANNCLHRKKYYKCFLCFPWQKVQNAKSLGTLFKQAKTQSEEREGSHVRFENGAPGWEIYTLVIDVKQGKHESLTNM